MKVEIFVPNKIERKKLDIDKLNKETGRLFKYASKGRYALEHILRSHNAQGRILIPAYICSSILEPINKLKLDYQFYDIDENDLNANLESIELMYNKTKAKFLIVASMYGNPANLIEIENYCKAKEIILIDDAAQSFGATLDGRYVGTFGNGGMFSFSPGKPTAGHMGAFYWSSMVGYDHQKVNHLLFHYLTYLCFYYNRLHIYTYKKYKIFEVLYRLIGLYSKYCNISNDDISKFESQILGGVIEENSRAINGYRKHYYEEFIKRYSNNNYFTIVCSQRGVPNNHKLILKGNTMKMAQSIMAHLRRNNIYCSNGYKILSTDLKYLQHTENIGNRVIEIPLEDDLGKMNYIFDVLNRFNYNSR